MEKQFTHLIDSGVHMVDVGEKKNQKRSATAIGKIILSEKTISLIKNEKIKKGNVLTTAQISAIQAVKNTSSIIPLCHSLDISGIQIDFNIKNSEIIASCSVNIIGKTGVEMEALTGVSCALLTIWDMVKSVEKDENGQYPHTRISDIKIIEKIKI